MKISIREGKRILAEFAKMPGFDMSKETHPGGYTTLGQRLAPRGSSTLERIERNCFLSRNE